MNKAFVREPESDGRAYCPRCGALGTPVTRSTMDQHIQLRAQSKLGDGGWFCSFADCDIAYFDEFDRFVTTDELNQAVYPKSLDAPICACFGFTADDLEQAIDQRDPTTIRELLAKSKSKAANCSTLAANGQCCMQEVQRRYIRGIGTNT